MVEEKKDGGTPGGREGQGWIRISGGLIGNNGGGEVAAAAKSGLIVVIVDLHEGISAVWIPGNI